MAADVKTHLYEWSTTESSNLPVGSTVVSTNLDDNLRMIQKVVRDLSAPTTLAASAGTTDLGSKDETFITTTGTAVTITGLGTVSAGIYKWVIFNAAHVLTHNGTSLILPTAADITVASGDAALFVSLGSGNWKCVSYIRANGLPLVSSTLSGLIAAIAANTIANADYAQAWQWRLTTAAKQGFSITESAASTGAASILFDVGTIAASTAWPMRIRSKTAEVFAVDADGNSFLSSAAGENVYVGYRSTVATPSTTSTPGAVYISGQASSDTSGGGAIYVLGGTSAGGTGGRVNIDGGEGTGATGGKVAINGGTGTTEGGVVIGGLDLKINTPTVYLKNVHVSTSGAGSLPTISAGGGTGGAIRGSDNFFEVTFGTGSPTSVTVDFGVAYDSEPMVVVTGRQSGQVVHVASVSTTQVQISSSTGFSSGTKVCAWLAEVAASLPED